MKKVDWNGVEKCGWGMMGFCSSVRSTPFGSEPTRKQEQKKWIGDRFSMETRVESQENRTEN